MKKFSKIRMVVGVKTPVDKDVCVEIHTDAQGRLHSPDNDTPALVTKNGAKYWFHQGKVHREHGPAIIDAAGDQQFVSHGNVQKTVVGELVIQNLD